MTRMTPDVLCIGESMMLVAPTRPESLRVGSDLQLHVAGAESNTAINLARLGHDVAWASLVGTGHFGDLMIEHVAGCGVDVRLVERRPAPTGVYFKNPESEGTRVIYYRDGSAASLMTAALASAWAEQAHPRLVHISGITSQLSASALALSLSVVRDRIFGDAVVSFDVNHRPALASAATPDQLRELAGAADIVFVGADEAHDVWGEAAVDLPTLLTRRDGSRPAHIVVKNGGVDATEHHREGVTDVAALRVDVVEPVGAGDAFAAGWLSGYLTGANAAARLTLGHDTAARVLTSMSDTLG